MSKPGVFLFATTFFLSLIGIFILYESSAYSATLLLGDKYFFVKYQLMWLVIGVILAFVISQINYKRYHKLALPMLLGTFLLLVLVFIPGIGLELKGANRWINFGFAVFQPSELLKITLAIYLAAWLSVKEKGRLLAFLMLIGLSVFLVVIEPDMGTAMVIAVTSVALYFLSGSSVKEITLIGLIGLVGAFSLIKIAPYRIDRLTAFQNFDRSDLSTTSYHVKQILIALGSGGFTGVGFGKSVQKYAYLPENTTDSIFAIFAEESGFIGSVFLISIFILQLFLGFLISTRAPDEFGRLLSLGIIIFLGIQTIINLGSQAIVLPLTGIPLPFISYGGSSMVINFLAIGILLNISKNQK
ncbi:MAG: stage V sporulation protein E [Candidatus Levybacteria bacterium CG10_big_fil_rev_8_21_14_0_10_36_7]|nr:MAG: stage V sporulation protein E [Candidatus Levybacteria bacterium CG10_big_fil_rev_8_21_14_0_10_36_7]